MQSGISGLLRLPASAGVHKEGPEKSAGIIATRLRFKSEFVLSLSLRKEVLVLDYRVVSK